MLQLCYNVIVGLDFTKTMRQYSFTLKRNNFGHKKSLATVKTIFYSRTGVLQDGSIPPTAFALTGKPKFYKEETDMVNNDMTLIIASHEESLIKRVSDKIINVENGKVQEIKK